MVGSVSVRDSTVIMVIIIRVYGDKLFLLVLILIFSCMKMTVKVQSPSIDLLLEEDLRIQAETTAGTARIAATPWHPEARGRVRMS